MKNSYIYGEHPTPFGQVYLLLNQQNCLCQCAFSPIKLDNQAWLIKHDAALTKNIADLIGKTNYKNINLQWQGTDFQDQVWRALNSIPYGETRSYQQIAEAIARPTAIRAVANAIAKNPIAWFVPCHRVIRHNGELGGFAWGTPLKQTLLAHEQRIIELNETKNKN
jgi:O-6-methylguanine DNA methyltransferase